MNDPSDWQDWRWGCLLLAALIVIVFLIALYVWHGAFSIMDTQEKINAAALAGAVKAAQMIRDDLERMLANANDETRELILRIMGAQISADGERLATLKKEVKAVREKRV